MTFCGGGGPSLLGVVNCSMYNDDHPALLRERISIVYLVLASTPLKKKK